MSVELFIEKWSAPVGVYLYPWSIWKDGKQIHYGQRLKTPKKPNKKVRFIANTSSVKFWIASHISDERKEGTQDGIGPAA